MSDDVESFRRELDAARRQSTAQLLFKCSRLVNELALARLPEAMGGVRASHTALFPHIRLEGTRQTELARRVGISKQAVGQLVDDLEAWDLVTRQPDPEDRRAKRVVWTEHGRAAMMNGLAHLRAIEQELEQAVGDEHWQRLREALLRLHDHLDDERVD